MCGLIVLTAGLRPFGTFMEGVINCTIWVTGILASVSYHLFSEGKLVGVGNKACTYTVVALTFVVMFAIVVHVMLGVFSKERRSERLAGKRAPTVLLPGLESVAEGALGPAARNMVSMEDMVPAFAAAASSAAGLEGAAAVADPSAELPKEEEMSLAVQLSGYFWGMFAESAAADQDTPAAPEAM
jgi:hypothetical protein